MKHDYRFKIVDEAKFEWRDYTTDWNDHETVKAAEARMLYCDVFDDVALIVQLQSGGAWSVVTAGSDRSEYPLTVHRSGLSRERAEAYCVEILHEDLNEYVFYYFHPDCARKGANDP